MDPRSHMAAVITVAVSWMSLFVVPRPLFSPCNVVVQSEHSANCKHGLVVRPRYVTTDALVFHVVIVAAGGRFRVEALAPGPTPFGAPPVGYAMEEARIRQRPKKST